MSFIGNVPAEAYSPVAKDTFNGTGSQTDFTLSIPATTNGVEVFVENVQQVPTTAYTVSGTTLSFTAAPVSGTGNVYVIHRGPAVQTVVPPAGVAIDASTVTSTGLVTAQAGLVVDNDGSTVATFDRATSDGTIIDLQKDGSTVGSMGSISTALYVASPSGSDSGLRFDGAAINPCTTAGAYRDNAIDLGSTSAGFKDLYLDGGVYLGGTAATNKLDDYEEGTWTPTLNVGTSSDASGSYTKLGRLVTAAAYVGNVTDVSTATRVQISLPFTIDTGGTDAFTASIMLRRFNAVSASHGVVVYANDGDDYFRIFELIDSSSYSNVDWSSFTSTDIGLRATITYFTSA